MENKLREHISKAQAKIESKTKLVAKKEAQLAGGKLERWDVEHAHDDIKRLYREINELHEVISKHEKRLFLAEAEALILDNMPEALKQLQAHLIETWDAFDTKYQKHLWEMKKTMEYKAFIKTYGYRGYEFMLHATPDSIHKDNVKAAKELVLNTVARVGAITGEITDCQYLRVNQDNNGFMILNGQVIGKQGTAEVNSILAGGYNIQRLHVRVLVKPQQT